MIKEIISIYANSRVEVLATDKEFNTLWTNGKSYQEGFSALSLFGGITPSASGLYTGIQDGIPFQYNVIMVDADDVACIIELTNRNFVSDFYAIDSIRSRREEVIANIRNYIHNISSSINFISEALENEGSYLEMPYLDAQIKGCYNILRAMSFEEELICYAEGQTDGTVIDLHDYFDTISACLKDIAGLKSEYISITCDENICVFVNEERLTKMLLSIIVLEMKYIGTSPASCIIVRKRGNEALINIVSGKVDEQCATARRIDDYGIYDHKDPVSEKLDLMLLRLFCEKYNGHYIIGSGAEGNNYTVGITLPITEKSRDNILRSERTKVFTDDKFSPMRVALSEALGVRYY